MGYNQHSFVLLDLETRYLISTDGKNGVTMREATNFSQLEKHIYRTVRSDEGVVALETIRTFKSPNMFARSMDAIPDKEIQLALMLLGGADQKV